jgi:hypothetical protein
MEAVRVMQFVDEQAEEKKQNEELKKLLGQREALGAGHF